MQFASGQLVFLREKMVCSLPPLIFFFHKMLRGEMIARYFLRHFKAVYFTVASLELCRKNICKWIAEIALQDIKAALLLP